MSLARPKPYYTVDQSLTSERASEERHFFLGGEIFAMAGEDGAHADISANLMGSLVNQLKGNPCRARTKDTKVRSGPAAPMNPQKTQGLFRYPDIVVVCGEPAYHDDFTDVLLNPTAIVEVLSPSTEAFDRGEKFTRLQQGNPTLKDFILVSQDRPQIEHFSRQADGTWSYRLFTGLDATIAIASIDCTLKLTDVYDRIAFPSP